MVFITKSAEETHEIGKRLGHVLVGGSIITLHGELGAGKTTLTQGIAAGLGIESRITSPTFIIQRSYEVPQNNRGITSFFHVDLYRLEQADEEAVELGITYEWGRAENVFVIEWPERLSTVPPHIEVRLVTTKDDEREITINGITI